MKARIDATSTLLASMDLPYTVVQVGSQVVVLRPSVPEFDDVVVSMGDVGLMPNGLHVSQDHFECWARLTVGTMLNIRTSTDFREKFDYVNLTLEPSEYDPKAVSIAEEVLGRQLVTECNCAWKVTGAVKVAQLCISASHRELLSEVEGLVGRGSGSTPAGDDVLIGVCVALRMGGYVQESIAVATCAVGFEHRTTRSSRLFLRAASRGQFSERVHTLVGALSDFNKTVAVMDSLCTWGATSGTDLAIGMLEGITYLGKESSVPILSKSAR